MTEYLSSFTCEIGQPHSFMWGIAHSYRKTDRCLTCILVSLHSLSILCGLPIHGHCEDSLIQHPCVFSTLCHGPCIFTYHLHDSFSLLDIKWIHFWSHFILDIFDKVSNIDNMTTTATATILFGINDLAFTYILTNEWTCYVCTGWLWYLPPFFVIIW